MDPFIESLHISAARCSDALRRGPLDAPVTSCPGWSLADLARHLGFVHRWARIAALTAAPPDPSSIEGPPDEDAALADWIDAGTAALSPVLAGLDPAAPTWHPFPVAKVAAVWPRRQAHETQVHAWDAEHAVGVTSPLAPDIAADGIAEYFELIVPRVAQKTERALPSGELLVDCLDADVRLVVCAVDGAINVDRTSVDARTPGLRGTAEGILLSLWGRGGSLVAPAGHPEVSEWWSYGGN